MDLILDDHDHAWADGRPQSSCFSSPRKNWAEKERRGRKIKLKSGQSQIQFEIDDSSPTTSSSQAFSFRLKEEREGFD
jgi:hypothetical protein